MKTTLLTADKGSGLHRLGAFLKGRTPAPPYLFILPALGLFIFLVIYPSLDTVYYSLFRWSGWGPREFAGLDLYTESFGDHRVLKSFANNLIYVIATLVVEVAFGLLLAILLQARLRLMGLFRVLFFAPMVLSLTIVGILWSYVFKLDGGLINTLLDGVGLAVLRRDWLHDPVTALYAVCLVSGWTYAGFYMVLFYAGLKRMPREIFEAARLDGAGGWQAFRHLTLPLLREVTAVAVLVCVTGAFKAFDLFWVMTPQGGGPTLSTEIVPTFIVREGFVFHHLGYASAVAITMTAFVFALTAAYTIYTARRPAVEY